MPRSSSGNIDSCNREYEVLRCSSSNIDSCNRGNEVRRCSSGNIDSPNHEGTGTRCRSVEAVILIVVIVKEQVRGAEL